MRLYKVFFLAWLVFFLQQHIACMFLFDAYPTLHNIPYRSLGDLPTPVIQLSGLQDACAARAAIYMKSDGLSGKLLWNGKRLMGSNKVRKLEFLLADAQAKGFGRVLTIGSFGSNHALATACYAKELGLSCGVVLKPQVLSDTVRFNLLAHASYGAELVFATDSADRLRVAERICGSFENKDPQSQWAYYIPMGGSNAIGALGFVNVVFELRHQIQQGVMPEPDVVYVACSSAGTTAGLLIGLQLAQLKTKLVAVLIEPDDHPGSSYQTITTLFSQVNQLLHDVDPAIPLLRFPDEQLRIQDRCTGPDYGISTPESMQARELLLKTDAVLVDPTYTAKVAAALLLDIPELSSDTVVLFWNTFCPVEQCCDTVLYGVNQLPEPFQNYLQ